MSIAPPLIGNTRPRVAFAHQRPHLKQKKTGSVPKNSFVRNYKDINFDTLKERHDNFSFSKAIETQHQVHDTLHF